MLSMLALAAALQAPPTLNCERLVLADLACAPTPYGVVIADDQAMAERFAGIMRQGEASFRTHFGREPQPYAVIVGDRANPLSEGGSVGGGSVDLQRQLRDAGAEHVQPWFTAEQRALISARTQRARFEAIARQQGLEGADVTAFVEARLRTEPAPSTAEGDAGAAHELGHVWGVKTFWPDFDRRGPGQHYAGPGPDWFDETVAILLEDGAMAADRRNEFRTQWAKPGGERPKPLASYFVDAHPAANGASGSRVMRVEDLPPGFLPPGGLKDGQPITLSGVIPSFARPVRAPGHAERMTMFYAQGRIFADFLIDRSGDPGLYGRIATALAAGQTMEQWIQGEGPALRLGGSVADLERDWMEWLGRTYGPPG
jgi:hypothetical protein